MLGAEVQHRRGQERLQVVVNDIFRRGGGGRGRDCRRRGRVLALPVAAQEGIGDAGPGQDGHDQQDARGHLLLAFPALAGRQVGLGRRRFAGQFVGPQPFFDPLQLLQGDGGGFLAVAGEFVPEFLLLGRQPGDLPGGQFHAREGRLSGVVVRRRERGRGLGQIFFQPGDARLHGCGRPVRRLVAGLAEQFLLGAFQFAEADEQ